MVNVYKIDVVNFKNRFLNVGSISKIVISLFIALLVFVQLYKYINLNECFAISLAVNVLRE